MKSQTKHIIAWAVFIILALGTFAGVMWYIKQVPVINQYVLHLRDENGQVTDFQYGALPSLTNPDYYQNVKGQLIASNADFIDADLQAMKLGVYKQGQLVKEVPIAAKGKPGSWFETPAGLYQADMKQKTHQSSFEPVYMNWNIPFQGNYFIHGWPRYNKTKQPVTSTDSAGCIRLTDDDAKAVYDLAEVGMPILVHEGEVAKDTFNYDVNIPELSGTAYLAADLSDNFVFLEHNQNISYPLADFAKLLNAFVVSEYMNTDKNIVVTSDMLIPSPHPRLIVTHSYTPYDLVFPMVLEGSNEAAEALSRPLGRTNFIDLMNRKAKSLGMEDTTTVDPSGVSGADITSARDLSQLAKAINQYRGFLFDMTRDPASAMSYGKIKFDDMSANNLLTSEDGYAGGIMTHGNDDKKSILAVFRFSFKDTIRPIVFISLDSTDPLTDVRGMVEYVKRTYK